MDPLHLVLQVAHRAVAMTFYRIVLNPKAERIWFPDPPAIGGEEVDPREFCQCSHWEDDGELAVPMPSGAPGRFVLGEFDYPLADTRVADAVTRLDDEVQCLPVSVDGQNGRYVILNVLRSVDCVDVEASEFDRFEATGSRPDLAGQFKTFYRLRLHPAVVPEDAHLFRVYGYDVALIASAQMKQLLEKEGANDGIAFTPVT